jgi:hypothetical protein
MINGSINELKFKQYATINHESNTTIYYWVVHKGVITVRVGVD